MLLVPGGNNPNAFHPTHHPGFLIWMVFADHAYRPEGSGLHRGLRATILAGMKKIRKTIPSAVITASNLEQSEADIRPAVAFSISG
jgi:hypothetical protein